MEIDREGIRKMIHKHIWLMDGNTDLLIEEIIEYFNYEGGKLAGDLAKEYKMPVGEIGCPHCGTTTHGMLNSPICNFCDQDRFQVNK